ncbi:hypothetical protein IAU60_000684 [Kwoniella sp. DSM 27419]
MRSNTLVCVSLPIVDHGSTLPITSAITSALILVNIQAKAKARAEAEAKGELSAYDAKVEKRKQNAAQKK